MSREFDIPKSHVIVAGTEYRLLGSAFAAGGQASLYEAVAKNSDVSRRFLIKRFHDSGDYSEEFESEELSQKVAANVHQAILAAAFHDKKQHTSVMLKASSDCSTVQEILIAWEDVPPEDPASDYFDMGRFLESIQIVKSLLGALSGIHKHGVLHMDVSPSNVMWGRTEAHGTAYLLDFSCCTKTGSIVGERRRTTLSFSAPEAQIPGTVLTPAADIYSVGAVFLLLVAGMAAASNNRSEKKWSIRRLPGEGNTNVTDRVDDLDIPDAYKSKLSEIIIKATTSVDKRYQSASEMLADMVELERIIAGRGMAPETLVRGSAALFRKECDNENGIFHYELQDDLVTEAVDFDSKTPVDILTQNTILLGGGGSGKTTKIRTLWEKCLNEWKGDTKNNPIPVFVPLNTFDSKKSNWDFFIRDYISTVYFPGLSMDVSQRRADLEGMFESTGKYILFLDGINEAVDSSMLNAEIAKLAAIKNVTVIITSRNNWGDDETKKLFSIAELMPLNDDLILRKLQENGLGSPSARLMETLHRPMFLALYLKIKITDNAVETPGQILLAYHHYLIDTYDTGHHGDEWKTIITTALDKFLPQLSSRVQRMRFNDDELGAILDEQLIQYRRRTNFEQAETHLISRGFAVRWAIIVSLKNCGIICSRGQEEYAFSHQNYLEFYQAYDVYLQMNSYRTEHTLPQCLCEGVLPVSIARYLGEIWGEPSFETKVDCTEESSPIEKWMRVNLAQKQGIQAQLAVKNCIEIMKGSRNCYITANYSDLDLSLVTFYNCFLPNSVFTRSIINDHIFLNFGHKYPIENVAILTKKNWLITTSRQEMFFWDLSSGAFIDKVPCEGLITHIAVSGNEEFVAAGLCEDGPLPVQVFRTQDRSLASKVTFWEEALHPEDILYDDLSACRLEHTSTMLCFASDNRTLLCEIGEYGIECIDVFGDKQPYHPYEIDEHHPRELITCALSPDRSMVACASSSSSVDEDSDNHEGAISLWAVETGEFIRDISLGEVCLKNIAFTADGKYIIGCDWFLRFHKWSIDNKEHTILFRSNSYKYAIVDGYVATEEGLYDLEDNQMKPYPSEVAIRPSGVYADMYGTRFAIATGNEEVSVFLAEDCLLQRTIEVGANRWYVWQKGPEAVACSADSVVRISACGELDKLNCQEKKMQRLIHRKHGFNPNIDKVSNFHSLTDQYYLRVNSENTEVIVWENVSGELLTFTGLFSDLARAKYYTIDKKLITVHKDGTVCIGTWGEEMRCFKPNSAGQSFPSVIIGETAVVGTPSGGLLLRSDTEHREVRNAHNTAITQIYAVANGDYFFTQAADRSMKIWNIHTLQSWISSPVSNGGFTGVITQSTQKVPWRNTGNLKVYQFELPGAFLYWYEHVESIFYDATASKDGKRIAVTDGDDIWVYNAETGVAMLHIKELPDGLSAIKLSSDGSILTAAFHDLTVKIYNIYNGAEISWDVISAEDISNCVFRNVKTETWIRTILQLNGAIFID